jgi:hypothetical protein
MRKRVLIFFAPIFGQQNMEGTAVNRGKIFTADNQILEGQYIVFSKDSLEYYKENSQVRNVLHLGQINEVQQYNCNYGTTGMWLGGAVGITLGGVVALGTKETKRTDFLGETTIQTWPIYIFTLVGTLGGYLIGASIESWDTIYSKDDASILRNINIGTTTRGGVTVSYHLNF